MTVPLYSDWTRSCVTLGVMEGDHWTPIGSALLIVQAPMVWLVTLESLLPPPEAQLSAWVSPTEGAKLFDLRDLHQNTEAGWIRDNGWAATLCPIRADWGTKALSKEQAVVEHTQLPVLAPLTTVQFTYGTDAIPVGGMTPYLFPGSLCSTAPDALYTTLPLQPRNVGAPASIVLSSGEQPEVRLVGVLESALVVPPPGQSLTTVRPISGAFKLLESEAAQAQCKAVLEENG